MLQPQMELVATNKTVYKIDSTSEWQNSQCSVNIQQELQVQILNGFRPLYQCKEKLFKEFIFGGRLPILAKSHARELPYTLENQWIYRQLDRYNQNLAANIHLKVFSQQKSQKACVCNSELDDLLYKPTIDQFFQTGKSGNKERYYLKMEQDEGFNSRNILILHDFYQHPYLLLDFISRLKGNVIMPYLPDIINMSQSQASMKSIVYILSQVIGMCKANNFIDIHILAHGTGCSLAIHLCKLLQSKKCIMCAPLINISDSQLKHSASYFIDQKQQINLLHDNIENIQEASFESVDEKPQRTRIIRSRDITKPFVPRVDRKINMVFPENENSEIELTEVPRKYSIRQRISSFHAVSDEAVLDSDDLAPREKYTNLLSQEFQENRSLTMLNYSQNAEFVISVDRQRSVSIVNQTNRTSIQIQERFQDHLIDLVNNTMIELYFQSKIASSLLNFHYVRQIKELVIITELRDFLKIRKQLFQKIFPQFMQYLYSVLILSPLKDLENYYKNESLFDDGFFSSLRWIIGYVNDNQLLMTDKVTYIIVGSHDLIFDQTNYELLKDFSDQFHIEYRCLIACGHNLFFYQVADVFNQLFQ